MTTSLRNARAPKGQDPLYVIFEQHLLNFQDADTDRKTFIGHVIKDYLVHLRKMNIIIPVSLETSVIEELATQVNTMLVKKIYGCFSIDEFQRAVPSKARRRAKREYSRLGNAAAAAAVKGSKPAKRKAIG